MKNGKFRPDVAVIKLKEPFTLNEHVQPACLPEKPITAGSKCYVSGTVSFTPP